MLNSQKGILQAPPRQGRYLFFSLVEPDVLRAALSRSLQLIDGEVAVLGVGLATVNALGASVPGLREMPAWSGDGIDLPSSTVALWCWLRGEDRGDLVHLTRQLEQALTPAFQLSKVVDAFRHGQGPNGHGRDLTGYEDGTENPQDDEASAAALVQGAGAGLDGSSFVAVQQWRHDFSAFEALGTAGQDDAIGRRRSDNEELDSAPLSAHVKRTAQESFEPQAFVLRRSMPWAGGKDAGLMFVAFGHSLAAFEAQMRRMLGLDDGVTDALFKFTRPLDGAYLWCPPLRDDGSGARLDLRQLGL